MHIENIVQSMPHILYMYGKGRGTPGKTHTGAESLITDSLVHLTPMISGANKGQNRELGTHSGSLLNLQGWWHSTA